MKVFKVLHFLSLLFATYGYRILGLFPSYNREYNTVYEPLLRELGERGHLMTVLTHFPLQSPPKEYSEISLKGSEIKEIQSDFVTDDEILPRLKNVNNILNDAVEKCQNFLRWPALKYFKNSSQEFDIIIFEPFTGDCHLGFIHQLQIPYISLFPNPISIPWNTQDIGAIDNPSYIPGQFSSFSTNMNFIQRFTNTLINFASKVLYNGKVLMKEQKLMKLYFGDNFPSLKSIMKKTSLVLVNSHYSLYGNLPRFSNIVEVGGIHIRPSKLPKVSMY